MIYNHNFSNSTKQISDACIVRISIENSRDLGVMQIEFFGPLQRKIICQLTEVKRVQDLPFDTHN